MPANSILDLRGIGRRRPAREDWLLKDISLSICPGDRWALVGPTGSGKSLLLRTLALLDPIDEGELLWHGRAVPSDHVPRYRSDVAYLLQRAALGAGTVEESLRIPFSLAVHHNKQFNRQRTIEQLSTLNRGPEFLGQLAANLSGGERQIVALSRTLQLSPSVLLLDEPTAAMDAQTARAVEVLIAQWLAAQPESRALVWVSHDQSQVTRIANKLIRLQAGRIAEAK